MVDLAQAPAASTQAAQQAPTPSVALRNLVKTFGDVVAVDGISLSVAPGEFVTLLGPSGCGKTTTLRMIGGFELPTSGELLINGQEMGSRPPYRRPVNTVFQNYALFPHMTVGQNVAYGLEMTRVPKAERIKRVAEALEMVRLPHVEKRKPSELSGGQQQRVALARALVNRPQALLLDEPLGALDLKLRKAMQLELKRLNREVGVTFIYVTHDQEEALTMSDRIAVMSDGRILQVGTPDEIYERPRSHFVADFIGQSNFLEGRVVGMEGNICLLEVPGLGHLRGYAPEPLATGSPSTLAIRPEKLSPIEELEGGQAPASWNVLRGQVTDTVYLGTHTQTLLRLPGDHITTFVSQNRGPSGGFPSGSTVELTFDPDTATILAG